MERKIILTADGTTTIQIPQWAEQYHSMHGAAQEARHVFLKMGVDHWKKLNSQKTALTILEIGFGTGLNALLTAMHLVNNEVLVNYEGVEAYPVSPIEIEQLNYIDQLDALDFKDFFDQMHAMEWEKSISLSRKFTLKKRKQDFAEIDDRSRYDLIYFDAFGARVQAELWGETIFLKMINALKPGGILVTYAAKGSVRRAMQAVGFTVERLPGPPGKREMLRAIKNK